jgi:hypothetical protein
LGLIEFPWIILVIEDCVDVYGSDLMSTIEMIVPVLVRALILLMITIKICDARNK